MSYREFDAIDAFVAAVQAAAITRVTIAWQREYGQLPAAVDDGPYRADYGRVRMATLLAYHQGAILRCRILGMDRHEARTVLEKAGLGVEERSRNLTSPLGDG
ncbi:MAG: hypothetical protein H0V44_09080 [Planctomycetes bacterium]|nr:hypothetical protein [Planctomycetota bacterium]